MAHLIYFLNGVDNAPESVLRDIGLGDRFPDGNNFRSAGKGPGDVNGTFVSAGVRATYRPDEQAWSEQSFGPDPGYRIGFWTDDRPTPAELARDEQIQGTPVKLLDGNDWLIPAARYAPQAIKMVGGKLERSPLATRRKLWAHIEGPCQDFRRGTAVPFEVCIKVAADSLNANYRMSDDPEQEVSVLEMLSTANVEDVLIALMDLRALVEEFDDAKKKDSD